MPKFRAPLGCTARHRVSGMEGVVVARVEYMTGCNQISIQPRGIDKDGQPFSALYFDEPWVEILDDKNLLLPVASVSDDNGCDTAPPPRRN